MSMVYGHLGDCYGEQYLNSAAIDAHKNAYALCGTAHIDRALYALLKIGDNYLIKMILIVLSFIISRRSFWLILCKLLPLNLLFIKI